ncbi:carbohydrate ABC transporter permease [Aureimonas altamirensis]|uniref:carbohydrate ABC transporter permease n=1 Tax=Aureimonas altamirensis TaxID=370622 RepID=UPI0025546719|nr:sugar ABC transporter permease [Aureimonas altamirensis]
MTDTIRPRRRWHIAVFLAPALLVYTAIMIVPLIQTLWLALERTTPDGTGFVGLANFQVLFGDPRWAASFWNALGNNVYFFLMHMLIQNPVGIALAALMSVPRLRGVALYRTAIFLPTILSFVIVGFIWKLILSPLWGIAPDLLSTVGLRFLFAPYLGQEAYALTAVSLVSVWQNIGIPMMLIYAALLTIPNEIIEAAECDGVTGLSQFFRIKLPLILPAIGLVSILTFVGNFNAFDLIYSMQGALGGPDGSTDILGTLLYRTFFGFQLQQGDRNMGAAIATAMFLIILAGVSLYLFVIQRRMRRYQL